MDASSYMILETISREEMEKKTAKQTSQFALHVLDQRSEPSLSLISGILTADRAQEDLMPLRDEDLLRRKIENFCFVSFDLKDAAICRKRKAGQ